MSRNILSWLSVLLLSSPGAHSQALGNHQAVYDSNGILLPWTSWGDALDREMKWYFNCPVEKGYPTFVMMTFMDEKYNLIEGRDDFIPSTQNGMGIISYLKYYAYKDKKEPKALEIAKSMGDYLVKESLTPDTGKYPCFTRSTGLAFKTPQEPDCGEQHDQPYEIQPDKGGIAGYALVLLFEETKDQRYLDQALQNARVLVANMRPGDDTHSPWQFRVDYRNGEARGEVSGNMAYVLRLFDKLIDHGHSEFAKPREALWGWIKNHQIPNLAKDGLLWAQFFEDHHEEDNRTAWSPLNLARYLIEKREALDPDWEEDSKALIDFTIKRFTSIRNGIPVCGEQDYDKNPWGGILSTYGAVLAMYCKATGSQEYKGIAHQALNYCLYAISEDGCPGDGANKAKRGGWQEDAHTDKIHNYLDAMAAFPEWGR
jgi:hypothetical protein